MNFTFAEKKMSEFTQNSQQRVQQLFELFMGIMRGNKPVELVRKHQQLIDSIVPVDVINVVDMLVLHNVPMEELKRGINKTLNLLYKTLNQHPYTPPPENSFLDILLQNNRALDERLRATRPLIKELNQTPGDRMLHERLKEKLLEIKKFEALYVIKENVLFPLLEQHWENFRCVQVMWSFQDDIRKNIKAAVALLDEKNFDLKKFNRLAGDIFFNMYAIKFRDERILFPRILETIPEEALNKMLTDSAGMPFPYVTPSQSVAEEVADAFTDAGEVDLHTGILTPGQIRLIFNHLPVDITYVDENNKVKYFSTPGKRIFPRAKGIIGRDVKNCHPPESVHVVEQIVEAFRNGEKDQASFWIRIKGEYILIRYFAVRDEDGRFRGTLEVSQEISELQKITGEKRLLDWE